MTTIIIPAPAPQWLLDKLDTPTPAPLLSHQNHNKSYASAGPLAERYLCEDAPTATMGQRNHVAFTVAARLRDFGTTETQTYEHMQWWADNKCEPPIDDDELKHVINSVFKYARSPQGNAAPENDFKPIIDHTALNIEAVKNIDPVDIPPRKWILGDFLLAEKVTELIAPPGAGKSTFSLAVALSVITGNDYLGMPVKARGNVLMINNEDDQDELYRRQNALLQHHNLTFNDVAGRLFPYSGVERPFIVAKRTPAGNVKPVDKDFIINFIQRNNIKLLIADPFLETHHVAENSNEEIAQVGRFYREIAVRGDCAVLIIHHTRKLPAAPTEGHIGNMDSGRGASALTGVARVVATLYNMSKKDAKTFGVGENNTHRYVRLDGAKANLSLQNNNVQWYEKISVKLANGDNVGVLAPVDLTPVEVAQDNAMLEAVVQCVHTFDGEVPLQTAAKFVCDALGDQVKSLDTTKRKLKELLAERTPFDGWVIWYEEDNRPESKTKHWVYGYLQMPLDDE